LDKKERVLKMSFSKATKRPVHGGAKIIFDKQKELVLDSKCFGELLDFWKKYKRTDKSQVIQIKSESYPLTCGLCMRTILPDRRRGLERRDLQYKLAIPDRRTRTRRKIGVGIKN
jgi:hypothetical protein